MEIGIFKALDHLFCNPDNPIYLPIQNDEGVITGYFLDNIINVCKQHAFVTAIEDKNRDYVMLVFGKYRVRKVLLEKVGVH